MAETNFSPPSLAGDDGAPSFDWKRLYKGALFETDSSKLRGRIIDAQIAVLGRSTELVGRPRSREHQELEDAWRFLYLLQSEVHDGKYARALLQGS